MKPARRNPKERGFALLIVFMLAAAIALMLYQQIPRVAFESQRDKEQLLQDHGKEYVRAIQLYYIQFKKYPTKIEDLESTNDKRFLRRRFVDPMTGKDEWRLIHVNGVGQLTDSLVQKPPSPTGGSSNDPNNPLAAFGTGAGSGTGNGSTDPNAPAQVNAAVGRRPSDRPINQPGSFANPPANVDPNDPRYWPPTSIYPQTGINPATGQPYPNQGQQPGQTYPGQTYPGQTYPGQTYPGQTYPGQSGAPGSIQPIPGQPPMPGQIPGLPYPAQPPAPGQPPSATNPYAGQNPNPGQNQYPGQPGQIPTTFQPPLPGQTGIPGQSPGVTNFQNAGNGQPVPGAVNPLGGVYTPPGGFNNGSGGGSGGPNAGGPNAGGPGQSALGLINNQLTGAGQPGQINANSPVGAGGLVGVASTFKGPSIKVYNDRQKYEEWEFVFDLKQMFPNQTRPGQPGQGLNPNQNGQQNGQSQNGQNGSPFFNGNGLGLGNGGLGLNGTPQGSTGAATGQPIKQ